MIVQKPRSLALLAAGLLCLGGLTITVADVPVWEKHYQAAHTALEGGDVERARRELRLSLQDNPLDGRSHFLLASLLAWEGDLDQAIVGFQQAAILEPNNAVARYNLGTTLLRRSEPVTAARLLEDSIQISPDHVPSYNNLGKAYLLAGIPELAVASYREALRRDPNNAVARRNLSRLIAADDAAAPPPSAGKASAVEVPGGPGSRGGSAIEPTAESGAEHPAAGGGDPEVEAVRDLARDLPHVNAERRGGQLALTGWTSGTNQRKLLDKILAARKEILDLTTDDAGDTQRLLEVDAVIFKILGYDSQSIGHNFLRRIQVNASVSDGATAAFEWLYSAAIGYEVNIANALEQKVAFLARPHLTTVSGTPASFVAGGDIVFKVSGLNSGDIKPYPFGTTLEVTPTLLRSPGEDGLPRVRLTVKAGRRTFLTTQEVYGYSSGDSAIFENVSVSSEAVLSLNQTLILTGLSQRERRTSRSGVPGLRSVPVIKYLFSEEISTTSDLAIVILLTPRDPAFWDEQNRKTTAEFVERRKAFVAAVKGTEEDMRRFRERYPDWQKIVPNRLSSHFYLLETNAAYRKVNGIDLADESLNLDLLGKVPAKKGK